MKLLLALLALALPAQAAYTLEDYLSDVQREGVVPAALKAVASSGASIGGTVTGGTNNSVLFVNPAGVVAQDNPNFTYTIGTTTLAAPTINASTKFLAPNGTQAAPSFGFASNPNTGMWQRSSNQVGIAINGVDLFAFYTSVFGILSNSGIITLGSSSDVVLNWDAANTLRQSNGTNPQAWLLANTRTDASNYEQLGVRWAGNVVTFKAEALGTGTQRRIDIVGTPTNDNAAAGAVGEYISSTIATGSSITLTTNVAANVTSVSLTAGDWDCSGATDFTFGATTSYTNLIGSISTTSATLGAQDSKFDYETAANVPTASADATWALPNVRVLIASTTTVYLVAQGTFTVSSLKAYGTLRCRRVR
jgi:hypothetical protein